MWISAGIAVLMLIDLWSVDRRYLNDNNFSSEQLHESYKATVADNEILKDKDPSYRVFNLNDPWQDTSTSYYHKSIGGYHAAKLRRYQELIDHRLSPEYMAIIKTLQKAKTAEDVMSTLASTTSLDMLNMRYIIYNPEQAPIRNPYAYGNAWFVGQVQVVNNADAEIAALDSLKPLETAVVDKRFADDLKGFVPQKDTAATIVMTSYKPNVVTYKTKAASEQLAVFSEIYYQPGWKAFVDGKLAPHFRADWTLRAMRIPAGEHQIAFKFIPDGYIRAYNIAYYGGIIILLLFAGAIVYSVGRIWKQRKVE